MESPTEPKGMGHIGRLNVICRLWHRSKYSDLLTAGHFTNIQISSKYVSTPPLGAPTIFTLFGLLT